MSKESADRTIPNIKSLIQSAFSCAPPAKKRRFEKSSIKSKMDWIRAAFSTLVSVSPLEYELTVLEATPHGSEESRLALTTEETLFHTTDPRSAAAIVRNGFDPKKARKSLLLGYGPLGQASYLTPLLTKAISLSTPDEGGNFTILVSRLKPGIELTKRTEPYSLTSSKRRKGLSQSETSGHLLPIQLRRRSGTITQVGITHPDQIETLYTVRCKLVARPETLYKSQTTHLLFPRPSCLKQVDQIVSKLLEIRKEANCENSSEQYNRLINELRTSIEHAINSDSALMTKERREALTTLLASTFTPRLELEPQAA